MPVQAAGPEFARFRLFRQTCSGLIWGVSLQKPNSPFHLLLVEDEYADAELFSELLSEVSNDIELHHVLNGQEALDFVTLQGQYTGAPFPNLIVLDINMPVMNGHEFLRRAKRDPRARTIPVLVLSTSDNPRDITEAYHEYASSYVVKPGSFAEYRDLIALIGSYWRGAVQLPTVDQIVQTSPTD